MAKKLSINEVDRGQGCLKTSMEESNFVDAPADVLMEFVWELTKEVYSLKGGFDAEQRLQRNVTNLVRQRC